MSRTSLTRSCLFAIVLLASSALLAAPGEVTNLQWCAGAKTCLQWSSVAGAVQYRLYRGEQASLPCLLNTALDSCSDGQFVPTTTGSWITESPVAQRFYWFLVTAEDDSEGSYGFATAGLRKSEHTGACNPSCAPSASSCSVPNDCCSSSCIGGTCQTACCVATGSFCTTNLDCCSGLCSGGMCQTPCVPAGGTCATASQCCSIPNATPACQGAMCTIGSCNAGFRDCNGTSADGCEINTLTDPNNCGSCGHICPGGNGVPICQNGACGIACNPGFANCNGNVNDGCEVNTTNNPSNCSACNAQCPTFPNSSPACVNSACTLGPCNAGFANCNGLTGDGCEVNTTNNVNNCGACGAVCPPIPNGTPSCVNSGCAATCSTGFANCNGVYGDGCEVNLNTSHDNCGACNAPCAPDAICINAQCIIQ